ncbi:helix-turn-helix domain-containing protein [Bifidobacterium pseudocatenulatum]|nr:helix-turn-helix transcriptional regulator [Bifidobacterium pseudocatenulatum]
MHRVKTRRRMLGLSQADLGVILGLLVPKDPSDPKPVGQQTVSRWEEGVNGHGEPPYWVQDALPGILDRIGQVQEALARWTAPFLRGLDPDADGIVHVPTYRSDKAFARAFPKMAGWPASIWNNAVVRTADSLDDGREYQFDLIR